DLFDAIFQAMDSTQGTGAAWEFARAALQRQPSLLGLDRLLQAQLQRSGRAGDAIPNASDGDPGQRAPLDDSRRDWISDADAVLVRSLINRPAQRLGRYACRACGFRAKRFYWQCPGCNAWETYLPKR